MRAWLILLATGLFACGGGGDDAPAGDATVEAPDQGPIGDGGLPPPAEPPVATYALADNAVETPLAAVPWPNNIYRKADGRLDLTGFPRPRMGGLADLIIDAIETELDGFGTAATLFLALESRPDIRLLPIDGAASIEPDSTLFIVDVDPASPQLGRRIPIRWVYRSVKTQYLPDQTLRIRMVEGVVLRPMTTYALIMTTGAAKAPDAFLKTVGEDRPDGALGQAWAANAPLRAWLKESGVEPAVASVFTTQDTTSEMFAAREFMQTLDAPTVDTVRSRGELQGRIELFNGTYFAPRFQEGEIPYVNKGEGGIRFVDGKPQITGMEELRFALSVPKAGEMPPNGWPVVLYAHGTGGDFQSFYRSLVSSAMAQAGVAVLSMDQVHHGARDNGHCDDAQDRNTCISLLFFNFLIPIAGRDNVRQGALDLVSLKRLAENLEIDAEVSELGRAVKLDPNNINFMGHSQGGLNGPLFLAIEPDIRGGVLSGSGGTIAITIEQKVEPFDINLLVKAALALPDTDPLDRWHPTMMLLQTLTDRGDPVNYARHWFIEPAEGHRPKSIFMTSGIDDKFVTVDSTSALAAAGGVPIIEPVAARIEGLELLNIEPAGLPPYRGNVASGAASAGLAQYADEGHHVAFENPSATQRYRKFLSDLAKNDPPQIF